MYLIKEHLRFVAFREEPNTDTLAQGQLIELGGLQDTFLRMSLRPRHIPCVYEITYPKSFSDKELQVQILEKLKLEKMFLGLML